MPPRSFPWFATMALLTLACGGGGGGGSGGQDAGGDAGADAGGDAGLDAGGDAGVDGGGDAGVDAGGGDGGILGSRGATLVLCPDRTLLGGAAFAADGTSYLAGNFSHVGTFTGGGVLLDGASGSPVPGWPGVDRNVVAAVPDGTGGWYLGGDFTRVGSTQRKYLAHVLADGSVDVWAPALNAAVEAIAVAGGVVYAGGVFTTAGGQPRNYLAAFDASGAPTAWNPGADRPISALALSGSTLYVAGSFTTVGGKARTRLAALDVATGSPTSWDPAPDAQVDAVLVSGSTVYVSGLFTHVGGQARSYVAALDGTTGQPSAFDAAVDFRVTALAAGGGVLYLGGLFSTVGGQSHFNLAAVDAATGAVRAWDPGVGTGTVFALALAGTTLYAGGDFLQVGGFSGPFRSGLASFDTATAAFTAWNPGVDGQVRLLAASGGKVYAGNGFSSGDGIPRSGVASFDASGALRPWNPAPDFAVQAVALSGTTLYLGGFFTQVAGTPRAGLAAVDNGTGALQAWNPGVAGGIVDSLTVSPDGRTVYAGGNFKSVGGLPRAGLAAIDAATGTVTSWNPRASDTDTRNDDIEALIVSGSTVYVGGFFATMGGQPRPGLAAVDATTGTVTGWNPSPTGASAEVRGLSIGGGAVYVAGVFDGLGGQGRHNAAAVDPATGAATSYDAQLDGPDLAGVRAGSDGTVWWAGHFSTVHGQPRSLLARTDATGVPGPTLDLPAGFDPATGGAFGYKGQWLDLQSMLAAVPQVAGH